jgi:hypothetical protein
LGAVELLVLRDMLPETTSGDPVLSITSPVDLRQRLGSPSEGTLGACVSQLTTTLVVPTSAGLWDVARAVRSDLDVQLKRGDGCVFYTLYDWALTLPFDPKGLPRLGAMFAASPQAAILSNVGPVPSIEAEARLGVRTIGFAISPLPFQPVFVVATTYRGQLCIDVNYDVGKLPPALADQFLREFSRRLESVAEAGSDPVRA